LTKNWNAVGTALLVFVQTEYLSKTDWRRQDLQKARQVELPDDFRAIASSPIDFDDVVVIGVLGCLGQMIIVGRIMLLP